MIPLELIRYLTALWALLAVAAAIVTGVRLARSRRQVDRAQNARQAFVDRYDLLVSTVQFVVAVGGLVSAVVVVLIWFLYDDVMAMERIGNVIKTVTLIGAAAALIGQSYLYDMARKVTQLWVDENPGPTR